MGLALASMISSIGVVSSFGEDRWGRGRYEPRERRHDRFEHRRDWHDHDSYERRYGNREYRSERYGGRVYVPPPVVLEPPPLPGINILFPPFIFH